MTDISDFEQRRSALSTSKRALVEKQLRGDGVGTPALPSIPRRPTSAPPLSFAQQRLWFLDQLMPGNAFYNEQVAVPIAFVPNIRVFEQCLNEIFRRHEALRTCFPTVGGVPIQMIGDDWKFPLQVIDLSGLPTDQRQAEVSRIAYAEVRQPFDLSRGPLLRSQLVKVTEADYLFILTIHHIICDGWSLGVFARELTALYPAYATGQLSPLPDLPIQYADFAVWQQEWLEGSNLDKQLAYWREKLSNLPEIDLPTDYPRPAVSTFNGEYQVMQFSKPVTQALKAVSQQEKATLFMTLLAAFQTLLAHYTGQDEIVVGSPVAGRNRPEIEPLIGFFVNFLVMRTDLSGNPTFRELLRRVRQVALDAYAHQDVPFEKLVEELQPQRDLSRNPLFQISFQLDYTTRSAWQAEKTLASFPEVKRGSAKFDLRLDLTENSQGLHGILEYSTDLFHRDTATKMITHLRSLLENVAVDPDRRLSELAILTEAERNELIVTWNATHAEFPGKVCLHQLFEEQSVRTPEATAIVFGDKRLSYADLNRQANQLASYLRVKGVGPDRVVGICMEKSLELMVGILGVLKAGGAYLPLDPSLPAPRLAFMLQDAQVALVLTQERLVSKLSPHSPGALCLDTELAQIPSDERGNPDSGVSADNLAYVLYTSGSTGNPKGVMIPHSAIINHMYWMQSTFPMTNNDRVLQRTPIGFDASVWEFWAPLQVGACLVMPHLSRQQVSGDVVRAIIEHEVTIVQLVPTLLHMMLEESDFDQCQSLRRVFCGGEVLPVELKERLTARLNAEVVNLYGPTEACIDSTYWVCEPGEMQHGEPIGRPVANVQAYILDRWLQPVVVGVPGELYIGGRGLARGYLHRPALTAEKFIPDPFSDRPGQRLYRTGDLVRYRPDGRIEFLGRLDQQVKLRGYRIELGEIETVLARHPAVQEAAVVVRDLATERQSLVAFLVPNSQAAASVSELSAYLRQQLPDYMIPAVFVTLDQLPLTSSGKLDRRALPTPSSVLRSVDTPFVAPGNTLQLTIAQIWREVLLLDKVGLHDNFFDLGGHSLLMSRVHARLTEELNEGISMIDLFKYPTVHSLAQFLETEQSQAPAIEQIRDRAAKQKEAMRRRRERIKDR